MVPLAAQELDVDIVKNTRIARRKANEMFASADAESIKSELTRRKPFFLAMDPTIGLEMDWVLQLLTSGGTTRLKQDLLRCLPDSKSSQPRGKEGVSIAMAKIDNVVHSGLYRLVTKASQSLASAAREVLHALQEQRRPLLNSSNADDFMASFMIRCLNLHTCTDETGKESLGREALAARFQAAEAKAAKGETISLDHVSDLVGWSAWLGGACSEAGGWLAGSRSGC